MNKQLQGWSGAAGDSYWQKHPLSVDTPESRIARLGAPMKAASMPRSILEVGCGNGVNLLALKAMLGDESPTHIMGIEPNKSAVEVGRAAGSSITLGDGFALPFDDNSFDMVFTMGVLIHMADREVALAVKEMYRVANKYLFAMEYFSYDVKVLAYMGIPWRWTRPYQQVIEGIVPVALHTKGRLPAKVNKMDVGWWLFNLVPSKSVKG